MVYVIVILFLIYSVYKSKGCCILSVPASQFNGIKSEIYLYVAKLNAPTLYWCILEITFPISKIHVLILSDNWLSSSNTSERCGAQATGMTAVLRALSIKARSRTWGASQTAHWSQSIKSHHHAQACPEMGCECRVPSVRTRDNTGSVSPRRKRTWTVAQLSKAVFSDESCFCNQGSRVWRKSGEAQSPNCFKSSVKFPQSVMIWGAMSSAGVGPL